MKVLQVYKDYYPPVRGGIEGHMNLLANGLKQRGIDVSVLVSNTGLRLVREEIEGIPVTRVPQLGRFTSAPLNMTFTIWLRKLARGMDILHFHFPNPTAEISYLAARLDKRVIVTYHSDIVRQARLGKLYAPFMNCFLRKAETIIATSPAYLDSSPVLNRFRSKCTVIPLGIDLSRFSAENVKMAAVEGLRRRFGRPIILFIGRFRYYKGLHVLIDAMKRIDAVLLIVGAGPLEKTLREQAAGADVGEKVVFMGELSDRDVLTCLHACDVFVLPSVLRSEAFGIVQMEAMACGKPVVSTELTSGTSYVNQHGRTGLVVPPLDPDRMAEAVNLLIHRPELRAACGKAGSERVRSRFSSDRMIDRIVDLYAAPLRKGAQRGPVRTPAAGARAATPPLRPPVRKIKLLRIISRLNIGGPSIHVHLLTKGLDARKFETRLITGSISSREGSMEYLFGREDPKPIVISELQREIRLVSDVRAFLRIFRLLLQERPDMVHTHTAKAGFSARLAVMLYNAVTRRRVVTVHTFHGHVFEGYFHRLSTMLFINIERLMGRFTDAVIAISPSQKKALVEKYHIGSERKVHVISLGFDLAPFLDARHRKGEFRRRIGASENDILIGIVGRLVPIKNHRLLLRAARRMMASRSRGDLRFVIVGDGQLRNDLEAECRSLGIADAVHFCGWIRDIPMVYADLDILALTSINEGTPVSIIESMAASVPVMATDAGGVGDLLGTASSRGSHNGFSVCERGVLCHHPDEARVAAALDYLVREDAGVQKARVDAARDFVEARFGRGRLIREMESLYESLLGVQR